MRREFLIIVISGTIGGTLAGFLADKMSHDNSYITQEDFGTLAEAMAHGCEPEQDRIEQTIRDFCTTHPLTKGKDYDDRKGRGSSGVSK